MIAKHGERESRFARHTDGIFWVGNRASREKENRAMRHSGAFWGFASSPRKLPEGGQHIPGPVGNAK